MSWDHTSLGDLPLINFGLQPQGLDSPPLPVPMSCRSQKQRRDVVAVTSAANASSAEPLAPSRPGGEPKPDFQIFEDKVVRDRAVLSRLRHFTEYRIDIHACNHAAHTVGCSAATFVFARTMPERASPPLHPWLYWGALGC